jgi:hypothetical protein
LIRGICKFAKRPSETAGEKYHNFDEFILINGKSYDLVWLHYNFCILWLGCNKEISSNLVTNVTFHDANLSPFR